MSINNLLNFADALESGTEFVPETVTKTGKTPQYPSWMYQRKVACKHPECRGEQYSAIFFVTSHLIAQHSMTLDMYNEVFIVPKTDEERVTAIRALVEEMKGKESYQDFKERTKPTKKGGKKKSVKSSIQDELTKMEDEDDDYGDLLDME